MSYTFSAAVTALFLIMITLIFGDSVEMAMLIGNMVFTGVVTDKIMERLK